MGLPKWDLQNSSILTAEAKQIQIPELIVSKKIKHDKILECHVLGRHPNEHPKTLN